MPDNGLKIKLHEVLLTAEELVALHRFLNHRAVRSQDIDKVRSMVELELKVAGGVEPLNEGYAIRYELPR